MGCCQTTPLPFLPTVDLNAATEKHLRTIPGLKQTTVKFLLAHRPIDDWAVLHKLPPTQQRIVEAYCYMDRVYS